MLTYREALRAFADGKTLETKWNNKWITVDAFVQITQDTLDTPSPYRIRQATITINNVEVPEPLRVAPKDGTRVFVPAVDEHSIFYGIEWDGSGFYLRLLKRGLVHLTREAAEAHARALILASGGQV